jgi:hypothetical protein
VGLHLKPLLGLMVWFGMRRRNLTGNKNQREVLPHRGRNLGRDHRPVLQGVGSKLNTTVAAVQIAPK